MSIKVSIVVPVYNMQAYLEACLDSLVHQTLKDIEIIIVNDGSTDGSIQIINDFKKQYPTLIRVFEKENGGQATARNLGIRMSQGQYVGFVDADDVVDHRMYEMLYQRAIKEDCDLVECNYRFLMVAGNEERELRPYGHVRQYKSNKDMFLNPLVSPWNKLYRGSILRDNELDFPEGYIYEDTSFFIKVIPYLHKWSYVDEKFVSHYLRPNSTMTAKKSRRVGNIFPVLEDMLLFYEQKGFKKQYETELEYFTAKILLCSSMERIADITQKDIRKEMQEKTLTFLNEHFPNYKRNEHLQGKKVGIYMKAVNKVTIRPICFLLQMKNRMKKKKEGIIG